MKVVLSLLSGLVAVSSVAALPRIVVLDFESEAGASENGQLVGGVSAEALSRKGAYVLNAELVKSGAYSIVDRRDFTSKLTTNAAGDEARPSYIHAAQLLRADAVMRGVLLSFSTGKVRESQAGFTADFTKLSMTVMVQVQDAIDGTVIAMAEGNAQKQVRQTAAVQTELGEDELLGLLREAINKALPDLEKSMAKSLKSIAERDTSMLTVLSTDDPALVEIDGVLVGSTPLDGLSVYSGDHVIAISRPGYAPISKRLVINQDTKITAPMLRLDISAEERVKILSSAEMKIFMQNQKPDILIQELK